MWPPMGDAVGDEVTEIPSHFDLRQNYPNPFNPMTTIRFDLPDDRQVRVEVFAIDGRRVATLVDGALPAGYHEVIWSGRDTSGRPVASGTYLYRIMAGPDTETRRMTLVK
jgi:flagellar hook assembly protein FlgD